MNQSTRVSVAVPDEWANDAEEMDQSKSEYVRRMVRAGRRQWGYDHTDEPERKGLKDRSEGNKNMESVLQSTILQNLSTDNGLKEDELADLLFSELINTIETQLQELKDDGKVDYNVTGGGWVKTPSDDQ